MTLKLWRDCAQCRGTGKRLWTRGRPAKDRECPNCKGSGTVQITVTIPED